MLLSAGAYQSEEGYDFNDGLAMPSYTVDNEASIGLSSSKAGGGSGGGAKEIDPAKLEKMQAAAAKKAEAKAAAAARAEAKRAAALAAEEARREANAAKLAEKEEAKARQLANMGEAQRAKIEAYNAAKAGGNKKGPSAMDNMKRMYGI